MKEKFPKSLSIAFEVDELDLSLANGKEDLTRVITSIYPYWAKVVKVSLEVLELDDNLNQLFLYNLVILADLKLTTLDEMKESWKSLTETVSNAMEDFLKLNSINYVKLG